MNGWLLPAVPRKVFGMNRRKRLRYFAKMSSTCFSTKKPNPLNCAVKQCTLFLGETRVLTSGFVNLFQDHGDLPQAHGGVQPGWPLLPPPLPASLPHGEPGVLVRVHELVKWDSAYYFPQGAPKKSVDRKECFKLTLPSPELGNKCEPLTFTSQKEKTEKNSEWSMIPQE